MAATIKKVNDNAQTYVIPEILRALVRSVKCFMFFFTLNYQDFFFPNSEGNWKKNFHPNFREKSHSPSGPTQEPGTLAHKTKLT